jgi:hypothetical protein
MESSISFKNVTLQDNPLAGAGSKQSERSKIFSVLQDSGARERTAFDYRCARHG